MPKLKSKPAAAEINPAHYNDVVARAKLQAIRLLSSEFDVQPLAYEPNDQGPEFEIAHNLIAHSYDRERNQLSGLLGFEAQQTRDGNAVLSVAAEYLVDYLLNTECEEDAAELFVERLAPFAAYPYFRSLFSQLTSQAGLLTPPLPILAEAPKTIARAKSVELPKTATRKVAPPAKAKAYGKPDKGAVKPRTEGSTAAKARTGDK